MVRLHPPPPAADDPDAVRHHADQLRRSCRSAPGGPVEQMIAQLAGHGGRRDGAHRRRRRRDAGSRRAAAQPAASGQQQLSRRAGPRPEFIARAREAVRLRQAAARALPRMMMRQLSALRLRRQLLPRPPGGRPGAREDAGLDLARPVDDADHLPDLDSARHRQGGARRLALRRLDQRRRASSATPSRASCSPSCWSCCSPAAAICDWFPLRGLRLRELAASSPWPARVARLFLAHGAAGDGAGDRRLRRR